MEKIPYGQSVRMGDDIKWCLTPTACLNGSLLDRVSQQDALIRFTEGMEDRYALVYRVCAYELVYKP